VGEKIVGEGMAGNGLEEVTVRRLMERKLAGTKGTGEPSITDSSCYSVIKQQRPHLGLKSGVAFQFCREVWL